MTKHPLLVVTIHEGSISLEEKPNTCIVVHVFYVPIQKGQGLGVYIKLLHHSQGVSGANSKDFNFLNSY